MKKRITYVLLVLLAVVAFAFTDSSKAKAAEALPLYYLQITGITSDGNDFAWDNITFSQTKAPSVLKGDKLHVRARFMGYTKLTVITGKDGKNLLYDGTARMYKSDAILGQNKVVIGWDKYFEIPMDALQDNSIQIKALSSGTTFVYSQKIDFERE
ncbi:YolA family protein [Bacillus inaquosorum]|uniref:YolA family protein n=1 Tax=Bacillus spizizenii TaxID=96241 RepID=A0A9Q4DPP9_BACSC|nr:MULTISPECIES: DUF4879 domain-containing protein [Bacillus subtilis group]MCY7823374.1 YolA family protein [Bacillus spizizenii]MCY8121687.1 YolA family protein [Bacillus spizizenii]MCY8229210.1 YolA family protein [Bacillus spizizenii]MCY8888216.1 YolA family protein [Bacillus spizizenii]MCY9058013.1 YolA family protein [Bacillus inaquosorum]